MFGNFGNMTFVFRSMSVSRKTSNGFLASGLKYYELTEAVNSLIQFLNV